MNLDLSVFQFLHGAAGQSRILDWLFVFFAQYLGYFLIAGFIFLLWKEKEFRSRWHYLFFGALTVLVSRALFTEIIRYFYDRPRPFAVLNISSLFNHASGDAFPSGHAAFYFALALGVWYMNRRWGWYFLAAASLIGLFRVIAGIHWPSDIIAGAAISVLSFFVVKYLLSSFKK